MFFMKSKHEMTQIAAQRRSENLAIGSRADDVQRTAAERKLYKSFTDAAYDAQKADEEATGGDNYYEIEELCEVAKRAIYSVFFDRKIAVETVEIHNNWNLFFL